MTKIRIFPHRTADPDSVLFGKWWIERNGVRSQLPDLLGGWDYAREELIGITLTIDEHLFLHSTGLSSLGDVEVILLADCKQSQTRAVSTHRLDGTSRVRDMAFELHLPAGQLAGALALSAALVVARDFPRTADRTAHLRGARLISSKSKVIALEGGASRFPTEPVPFSKLHLPKAPWTLQCTYESLEASFMGGVRLLVNTEHVVGQMLLDAATADRVSGIAMADVIRLLVATAIDYVEELATSTREEGSVAYVLENMCEFYLGLDLATAISTYQKEPLRFDCILHEHIEPFAKVFK
jgi:hypothetical protein